MIGITRRDFTGVLGGVFVSALATRSASGALLEAPNFRRGINFHHLLSWPTVETVAGVTKYDWPPFLDAGYRLDSGELIKCRALGFDFVRLTSDPGIWITSDAARRPVLEHHVATVIRRLLDAGFNVVFDLHPTSVNPAFRGESLMNDPDTFVRYVEMVARVAAFLAQFPKERIAFELINEPPLPELADMARWQVMMRALHDSARISSDDLWLVLTGCMWGDYRALLHLDLGQFRKSNVLYTFHYYDPHYFTHQGVERDEAAFIAGINWPIDEKTAEAAMTAAHGRIAAAGDKSGYRPREAETMTRRALDDLLEAAHGPQQVMHDFDAVAQWADAHGIPPGRILLGEFGCVKTSNGISVGSARKSWLEAVRRAAELKGFPWAYWAFKGYGGMELKDSAGRIDNDVVEALGLNAV